MQTIKVAVAILSICLMAGCANAIRGAEQQVNINAFDVKSGNVVSADCVLINDDGTYKTKSSRSIMIHRDKDPITIECQTDTLAGKTVIDGKVNGGFVAVDFFLIDCCLISCWVDGLSGAWSEYPSMIDVALEMKK